jgi:2-enoate reductase
MAYDALFEPVTIGRVVIKNRIAMAPMGLIGLTDRDGSPTQRAINYYVERARGGVGLIITSLFKVENEIETTRGYFPLISECSLAPLAELCETVHALGTKIFVQLTAGFGRVGRTEVFRNHPVSASQIPHYWDPSIMCRALDTEEVEAIVRGFGHAAEILATAGADGIELHGHEGYLFDQFTTAVWNKREDRYGGNFRARLAFPLEVLAEIKKRLGPGFSVQYRFGLKHYIKGLRAGALKGERFVEAGRDVEEGLQMARLLEEAGFDALHVDAGCYDSWYWAHPPLYQEHGCMADMAARAKEVVKIPVIAVGRLDVPDLAERIVKEGKADIVAIGRGLLADPYWPRKAQEGATGEIRPCIGCHDRCLSGRARWGRPLGCSVNSACGRETSYRLRSADKGRKVLIVGGGLAGMEAARVAAVRGHSVILYEKENRLGGHVREASIPDFKKDLRNLIRWYEGELKKFDVKIWLDTEATEALIDEEKPDAVLIATGSQPLIPHLPGIDGAHVVTCVDLLRGMRRSEDQVAIVGGGLMGCEVALWLAQQGRRVTVVEMLPEVMAADNPLPSRMNRIMLLDLLAHYRVRVMTNANVREITPEGVVAAGPSGFMTIAAGTVVLAVGMKSEDGLYKKMLNKVAPLYAIGDCREPRNITGAVWDGYEVGRAV